MRPDGPPCSHGNLEKGVLVLVDEPVDVVGDVPGVVEDDKVAAELESLRTWKFDISRSSF